MNEISDTIFELFRQARSDPQYAVLAYDYRILEEKFALLTQKLPEEEQDLIWAFVCTSDAMNWRMLEWICEKFGIPIESAPETPI